MRFSLEDRLICLRPPDLTVPPYLTRHRQGCRTGWRCGPISASLTTSDNMIFFFLRSPLGPIH